MVRLDLQSHLPSNSALDKGCGTDYSLLSIADSDSMTRRSRPSGKCHRPLMNERVSMSSWSITGSVEAAMVSSPGIVTRSRSTNH